MVLVQVQIGTKVKGSPAWLAPAPAAAYARMLAAGCPAGCITDAGRTYAEQKVLYKAYLAGELTATAAYPGTSKHETGRALDLAEPARAWVRAHGAAYGWQRDRVRNEPWHMEHEATTDTTDTTPTEDDMPTIDEIGERIKDILRSPEFQGYFAAVPTMTATVGGSTLGPAPMTTFVGDTRTDVMRILDVVRGLNVGDGSGVVDHAALAVAVADELDRRARQRLA